MGLMLGTSAPERPGGSALTSTVRDLPVVVIVILGKRITLDGEPIYHDGSRPLGEVAAQAVAERFARVLGRPVRAVASDRSGTCTLVVHPNAGLSEVARVTSTESEHFPESGIATTLVPGPSLPSVAVSHSLARRTAHWPGVSRRHKLFSALIVVGLLIAMANVAGRLSRDEASGLAAEVLPSANSPLPTQTLPTPTPAPTPTPTPTPTKSDSPEPPKITGVARQRPGGPMRLTIRSSVAPMRVDVVLRPLGGTEATRRTVLIPDAAAAGAARSVQVFAALEPQVYRWQVSADGRVVTGKIRVRAKAPVETLLAEVLPTPPTPSVSPPSSPTPSPPTRRPPTRPRGNDPIPPTPQI